MRDLVPGLRRRDFQSPQPAVRVAAVVQARDRLLAGVAALRERDVGLVETGLGGENALVELLAPNRGSRLDPQRLELARLPRVKLAFLPRLPRLDPVVLYPKPTSRVGEMQVAAQRRHRDLALRREPRAKQRRRDGLGDAGPRAVR